MNNKRKRPDMVGNKFRVGKHPWNFGKKGVYSSETLEKMAKAKVGGKLSEEHKRKIGLAGLGRKQSEESKRKTALAKFGENNPAKRPEVRAKMSEVASRPEVIASKERKMKYSGTTIEILMRNELERRNIPFRANVQINQRCNADIFIEPNIVVECDGDYWHNLERVKEKDKRRDKILKDSGFVVYRFWGHEIEEDISNCVEQFLWRR
jgi:very-short-patch-repair endonuclease